MLKNYDVSLLGGSDAVEGGTPSAWLFAAATTGGKTRVD